MKRHNPVTVLFVTAVILLASVASLAQQTLDRTKVPPPGPSPVLHVPDWTKTQLSNGATLIVSERHNLPLISFTITFVGGSNQFEPESKRGVAAMTSSMLTEGTATRTGDQLSDALQLLGTNVGATVGSEEGSIGFVSTSKNFEPTLAILADMMLNSTFPADALERLRGRTLVNLTQAKDQPNVIGAQVFARVLYGSAHPSKRSRVTMWWLFQKATFNQVAPSLPWSATPQLPGRSRRLRKVWQRGAKLATSLRSIIRRSLSCNPRRFIWSTNLALLNRS
jgi:hypothetical protein